MEIDEKIAAGMISASEIARGRDYWRDHLQDGVRLPTGETATITWRGLHHILDDGRLRAEPELMIQILRQVVEIRTERSDRRVALSYWIANGQPRWGYAILSPSGHVITMHYTRERTVKQFQRRGSLLWTR